MKSRGCLVALVLFVLLVGAGAAGYADLNRRIAPMPDGPEKLIRFEEAPATNNALARLHREGVVRDPDAAALMMRLNRQSVKVVRGTYRVKPGMTLSQVLQSLKQPVQQMVRLREGWWVRRQAAILEKNQVCTADEYIKLANNPEHFRKDFPFLPETLTSLEGYLYPDTYDLPPLLGAEETIKLQLKTFERKVLSKLEAPEKIHRTLTIASMVELEAAKDEERPKIAGVIRNRLNKRMRLEIDATVLYAQQKWYVLPPGVVRTVKSPYNTYLNSGLPPGPIGSPSAASIFAAEKPDSHDYLFYVALPDRYHLFATTYDGHRDNIRKVRRLAAEAQP